VWNLHVINSTQKSIAYIKIDVIWKLNFNKLFIFNIISVEFTMSKIKVFRNNEVWNLHVISSNQKSTSYIKCMEYILVFWLTCMVSANEYNPCSGGFKEGGRNLHDYALYVSYFDKYEVIIRRKIWLEKYYYCYVNYS